jgi:hypothetical protein
MRHTDGHTNIYSIIRDKLSLLRELVGGGVGEGNRDDNGDGDGDGKGDSNGDVEGNR